ncbi:hypothetical protein ABPG74_016784 [Tetrahymena malaccensis]
MGNNCSCLRESNTTEFESIIGSNKAYQIELKDKHFLIIQQMTKEIVLIQAFLRGFLARRKANQIKKRKYNEKVNEQLTTYSSTILNFNSRNIAPFFYGFDDQDDPNSHLKEFRGSTELENGAIYFGEWIGDVRYGKGIMTWQDGSKFEGYFKNSKANGRGRLVHANGEIYEGDWKDDKAHGYGVYTHLDGATYEGTWINDLQEGDGIERWPDGSVYEGKYKEGKKHGTGLFTWADGSSYEGDFKSNNIEGHGKYRWNDGKQYEGEWLENKRHGKGVFEWPDGRKYSGEFYKDQKQGFGVLSFNDGRKYVGEWKADKQHGKGQFHMSSGHVKEGIWENGKRVGDVSNRSSVVNSAVSQNNKNYVEQK